MRRREVIAVLGVAAIGTPFAGRAEPTGGLRRIGALMSVAESELEAPRRVKLFMQGLQDEGWRETNIHVEWRWFESGLGWAGPVADELVAMQPEVLVVSSTALTAEILRRTTSIPVVFALVADPVASGFVESLARPARNATGFLNFEASLAAKWVQLLKELVPDLAHVAMIFNPNAAALSGAYFYPPFEAAAESFGIRPSRAPLNSPEEIEVAAATVASMPGGGLVVAPDVFTSANRRPIIAAAARLRLPAIYPFRYQAADGGLMSYGIDTPDVFRLVGSYVGRILMGALPADLPVQAPTNFQLVINLTTARTLGLKIPPTLLARADEVIE